MISNERSHIDIRMRKFGNGKMVASKNRKILNQSKEGKDTLRGRGRTLNTSLITIKNHL